MRTLLTGEFATATATSPRADVYTKLEVQNASGTWKDIATVMGHPVTISARWGESIDTPVAAATFNIAATVQGVSLAPLISASPANVDDSSAYAPLLRIGGLVRWTTATMDHGTAYDAGNDREMLTGRIDEIQIADDAGTTNLVGPIALTCSDLGGWLMDCQVETNGVQYGTSPVGTALETVMQAILTANIPAGEPAVTLVKESASIFGVTDYQLGQVKLMDALTNIVLDAVGEDFRYRYDASHVSQPTWFNPDRSRVTVDATFPVDAFVLSTLSTSLANVRNYGRMQAVETSGYLSYEDTVSSAPTRYRRRMFQLVRPVMLTTDAQALAVLTAAVNDLSDAPEEVSAVLPYCWFVQLFDRYTFAENNRQFDSDQTWSVVGYQHALAAGQATTTLTLTGRVVGAYAQWLKRLSPDLVATSGLARVHATDSSDGLQRTFGWTRGLAVSWVAVYYQTIRTPVTVDGFDFTGIGPIALLPPGTDTYTVTLPVSGEDGFLVLEPRLGDLSPGLAVEITLSPPIPHDWSFVPSASEAAGVGTATLVLSDPGSVFDPATPITFKTLELGVLTTGIAPTTHPGSGTSGTYTYALTLSPLHPIQVIATGLMADGTAVAITSWTFDSDKIADVVNATVANNAGTATVTIVWDTDALIGANCARYSLDAGVTWTSTVTIASGYLSQFTVTRTSAKQTVLVQAKNAIDAGATWGNQSTVEVDALEIGTIYCQCTAAVTAVTATTVTVTVTASATTGTPTVGLVGVSGSTTLGMGHAAGTYTYAQNGTDNVWVLDRGAFAAGIGQAQFRAVLAGTESDDDFVDIPEQGRDTVFLATRARATASDANTVTVRVAVADPYPQGAGSVTVAYTETGGTGTACSPTSGGTVTPAATLTEAAGTYIDYTATRPDFGTGTRRITYTATASGRVSDSDAIDVPAKERDTVALQLAGTRGTVTGNDIAFSLAAADPYPQGSGNVTVTAVATGGCSVSPSSATIACTSTTTDLSTTGTAAFTVTRGTSAGRVAFTATNANRTSASDAADVEQEPYSLTLTLDAPLATGTGGAAGPPYTELDTSWTVAGMPTGVTYDVSVAISGGSALASKGLTTTSHTFTGVTFNTFGGFSPGNGTVTVVAKLDGNVIAIDVASGLFAT